MISKKKHLKSKRSISLETKLEVLKLYEMGNRGADIANALKLPSTTVRSIFMSKDKIKQCADSATSLNNIKIISTNLTKVKMESMLKHWIDEQTEKNVEIKAKDIMEKAKVLYRDINEIEGYSNEPFIASRGWYHRFCRRLNINRESPQTKEILDTAKTRQETIITLFNSIVEEHEYLPNQVFNMIQTNIFWKRMPGDLKKDTNAHDPSNVRATLLLGANASGDFKLKPMFIYNVKNPPSLRGYANNKLPVIWRTNHRACITPALIQDWFLYYFEPAVTSYCKENKIPPKILLILDDSPYHPQNLNNLFPNIQVVYFSSEVMKFIQPMDQGILILFKACYLRILLSKYARTCNEIKFQDFLKEYTVMNAIENVSEAWEELSIHTMCGIWHKLWHESIGEYKGFAIPDREIDRIIDLSNDFKVEGMGETEIREMLKSHDDVLLKQDLNNKPVDIEDEEEMEEDEESNQVREIKTEELAEIFLQVERAMARFSEIDPIKERSLKVCRDMRRAYGCYMHIYREKIRQKKSQRMKMTKLLESEQTSNDGCDDSEVELTVIKHTNSGANNSQDFQFVGIDMLDSETN